MSTMCPTALTATRGGKAGAGPLRVAAAAGDVAVIEELIFRGTSRGELNRQAENEAGPPR